MNIKTWQERLGTVSDERIVTTLMIHQEMQAEIDELRAERDRLANELLAATIRIENDGMELERINAQEPVAWMIASALDDFKRGYIVEVSREQDESDDIPLYRAAGAQPVKSKTEESFKNMFREAYEEKNGYTSSGDTTAYHSMLHAMYWSIWGWKQEAPVQAGAQERKPLTDEQIIEIRKSTPPSQITWGYSIAFARAIEAKLKEQP